MSTLTKIWEINCQFYPLDSKEKVAESRAPPIQPQKCVKYPKYFPPKYQKSENGTYMYAQHTMEIKAGCNTIEYTTAFLYSDWLYFVCCGININIVV